MPISFDLDDTLICYQDGVPRETPLSRWWQLFVHDEPLRQGARSLMQQLRLQGWEVWVYTTSYRNPGSVRRWLRCHGIRVERVINQTLHEKQFKRTHNDYPPSKNPGAFGIHLHMDDSIGVQMEGVEHGFRVVVISPHDTAWADKVRAAADAIRQGYLRPRSRADHHPQ